MKIFLVGATGRTGKCILETALNRGHRVSALVREPVSRLPIDHSSLTTIGGDLLTHENLESCLSGHDAIVSALSSTSVADGTQRLIAAADAAGVSRFIGIAGGGILQLDEIQLRRDRSNYPEVFRKSSSQHLTAWRALEASSLDWTLLCTPDLIDAPATGNTKYEANYMPAGGRSIPAGDVANFLFDELEHPRFLKKRVGLTL